MWEVEAKVEYEYQSYSALLIFPFLLNPRQHFPLELRTHPVEHAGPSLHCDALEDSQHRKQDIIEWGDAIVRSLEIQVIMVVLCQQQTPVSSYDFNKLSLGFHENLQSWSENSQNLLPLKFPEFQLLPQRRI